MVMAKLIVFQKCVLKYLRPNVLERRTCLCYKQCFISCVILYGRGRNFQEKDLERGKAEYERQKTVLISLDVRSTVQQVLSCTSINVPLICSVPSSSLRRLVYPLNSVCFHLSDHQTNRTAVCVGEVFQVTHYECSRKCNVHVQIQQMLFSSSFLH